MSKYLNTDLKIIVALPKVTLQGFQCARCDHVWLPRYDDIDPAICPKCKSKLWNVKKTKKK